MKNLFLFLSIFIYSISFSQDIDTITVRFEGVKFYHVKNKTNSKILIFLHGGVNNPIFDDTSKTFELNLLFEGNKMFIPLALKNGYDLLIPVTNDRMNWLENHQYCYEIITSYLDSAKSYDTKNISGFSDGGTGSYKIFYDHPDDFNGLVVFNGYPQHKNFYSKVKYDEVGNKKVVFFSTFEDKVIPYEFLLTEYCKQKKSNANTFFYVKDGQHSFDEYGEKEFNICFDILISKISNTQNKPIHAYIEADKVIAFYPFRKKIWKKFGYGEDYYLINREQSKQYKND